MRREREKKAKEAAAADADGEVKMEEDEVEEEDPVPEITIAHFEEAMKYARRSGWSAFFSHSRSLLLTAYYSDTHQQCPILTFVAMRCSLRPYNRAAHLEARAF